MSDPFTDDGTDLHAVAALCSRAIYAWAGPKGFDGFDLKRRVHQLDALCYTDQFRVFTLLAKNPYLATTAVGPNGWRFWARHHAPKGAYVVAESGAGANRGTIAS